MGAHTLIDIWWLLGSLKMPEKNNWRLGVARKCRNYGYKLNIVIGEPDCARSICRSLAGQGVGNGGQWAQVNYMAVFSQAEKMQSFGDPLSVISKHESYEIGCNWKEIFMALKIFVPLLAFSFILTLLRLNFGR